MSEGESRTTTVTITKGSGATELGRTTVDSPLKNRTSSRLGPFIVTQTLMPQDFPQGLKEVKSSTSESPPIDKPDQQQQKALRWETLPTKTPTADDEEPPSQAELNSADPKNEEEIIHEVEETQENLDARVKRAQGGNAASKAGDSEQLDGSTSKGIQFASHCLAVATPLVLVAGIPLLVHAVAAPLMATLVPKITIAKAVSALPVGSDWILHPMNAANAVGTLKHTVAQTALYRGAQAAQGLLDLSMIVMVSQLVRSAYQSLGEAYWRLQNTYAGCLTWCQKTIPALASGAGGFLKYHTANVLACLKKRLPSDANALVCPKNAVPWKGWPSRSAEGS